MSQAKELFASIIAAIGLPTPETTNGDMLAPVGRSECFDPDTGQTHTTTFSVVAHYGESPVDPENALWLLDSDSGEPLGVVTDGPMMLFIENAIGALNERLRSGSGPSLDDILGGLRGMGFDDDPIN